MWIGVGGVLGCGCVVPPSARMVSNWGGYSPVMLETGLKISDTARRSAYCPLSSVFAVRHLVNKVVVMMQDLDLYYERWVVRHRLGWTLNKVLASTISSLIWWYLLGFIAFVPGVSQIDKIVFATLQVSFVLVLKCAWEVATRWKRLVDLLSEFVNDQHAIW